MLPILPPPAAFKGFTYIDPVGIIQSPTCLHDVLIASHVSTCEHSCFFFGNYHRNLMVLAELFINYADEFLTKGKVPDEILMNSKIAPAYQKVFD